MIYAETLYQVKNLDPRLEAIADATYEFDLLEGEQLRTILKRKGLSAPTPDEWDHLRFPFTWPPSDDGVAAQGLELAIRHYVGFPQVKAALQSATDRLAQEFSEENYAEQQRLRRQFSEFKVERRHFTAIAA
jgi:DNA primase